MSPGHTTLSLVLIARNEARCIARCLDSVRPWVDRLFVLDTGSDDATVAIARAHGATVQQTAWPNDFSAARNQALDLANADWNLVLDADEWIESGGATLRAFCTGPAAQPAQAALGVVCVASDHTLAGAGHRTARSLSWIPRLLPRGVRYAGRVHEQPVSHLPRQRLALQVGHDGYLEAQLAGKRTRNRPLLLRDLQDRPSDAYLHFQLGKDAEAHQDLATACDHYAQAWRRRPAGMGWLHDLTVRYLHALGQVGRGDEALALAEAEMAAWSASPDFFFVLGNLLLDCAVADPAQAVGHWLPLADAAWERCLAIGEQPQLDGSVAGRGSHLAAHNLATIRGGMAGCVAPAN